MQNTNNGRTVLVDGRIVWIAGGDLFKGDLQRDPNTKQPRLNAMGEQVRQYGFGLAVPKASCGEVWNAMMEEAFTMFPQARAQGRAGIPPSFSLKYKDGDTDVDEKGVGYNQRKGYPGNIVLSCTTTIPIKFFKYDPTTRSNVQINEGIKCGDYVKVQLTIKAHPAVGQGKAGNYMNPMAVQFLAYGEEIVNTPSGDSIFGVQAPAIPAGGSATPFSAPGLIVPTVGGAGQPAYPQQAVAGPAPQQFTPPPVQQQAPAPYYNALPPQFHPPGQPQTAPAPGSAPVAYPSNQPPAPYRQ